MNDFGRFTASGQPAAQKKSKVPPGVLKVVSGFLGVLFTFGAVVLAADPINAAAYFLGYGEELQVEVTKSSVGDMPGRGSKLGEGRVIGDGRVVHLYGARAGETVKAKPVLLDVSPVNDTVYHEGAAVAAGFTSVIGVFLIGGFGLVFLLGGIALPWRRQQPPNPDAA